MPSIPTGVITRNLIRFSGSERASVTDQLAQEEPLEIAVRHRGRRRVVAITMRTPGDDPDLAVGFLFGEGLLPPELPLGDGAQEKANTITLTLPDNLDFDPRSLDRHGYTSSSCGVCGKTSLEQVYRALPYPELPRRPPVSVRMLYRLPERLRDAQTRFMATGGIHAAGLFSSGGELLTLREDVGRHNALDKVIGHHFRGSSLPLDTQVLVLSGRASFELLQKAAMAGLQTVISVGAPSSLAVSLAEEQGITLCGFVRPGSLNAYTHAEFLGTD